MKMAKYRKRCFDQIEGIEAENKALTAEVDRLRSEVEEKTAEMGAQEWCLLDLNRRLATRIGKRKVSHAFRVVVYNHVVGFVDQ